MSDKNLNSVNDVSDNLESLKKSFTKIMLNSGEELEQSGEYNESLEKQFFNAAQYEFIQELQLNNAKLKIQNELRKGFSKNVFIFLVCYSSFVAIILLLQGFGNCPKILFHINNTAIDILIGSTAVSVLGLVKIILSNLFPSDEIPKQKR